MSYTASGTVVRYDSASQELTLKGDFSQLADDVPAGTEVTATIEVPEPEDTEEEETAE